VDVDKIVRGCTATQKDRHFALKKKMKQSIGRRKDTRIGILITKRDDLD
jgi:hypothetical protein